MFVSIWLPLQAASQLVVFAVGSVSAGGLTAVYGSVHAAVMQDISMEAVVCSWAVWLLL